jgi:hypothetical protein
MCVWVTTCHHTFIAHFLLILVLTILKLAIELQKGGLMNNYILFKLKNNNILTAIICFFETLWAIGCSMMAGENPA